MNLISYLLRNILISNQDSTKNTKVETIIVVEPVGKERFLNGAF